MDMMKIITTEVAINFVIGDTTILINSPAFLK